MRLVLMSELPGVAPTFEIDPSRTPTITLGRQAGNNVTLPDVSISRKHAQLEFRPGGAVVTDLGSSNGTFVNERQVVATSFIHAGDTLRVGNINLRFEMPETSDADDEIKTQMLPQSNAAAYVPQPAPAPVAQPAYTPQPAPTAQPAYTPQPAPQPVYNQQPPVQDYGYNAPPPARPYEGQPNPYAPVNAYTSNREYAAPARDYSQPQAAPLPPPPVVRRRSFPLLPVLLVLLVIFLIVLGVLGAMMLKIGPFGAATKTTTALPSAAFSGTSNDHTFFDHFALSYPTAWTAQANPSPNQTVIYAPDAPFATLNIERAVPAGTTDPRPTAQIALPDPNATSDTAIAALLNGFRQNNKNVTVIKDPAPVALKDGTNGTLTEFTFDDGRTGVSTHLEMLSVRVPNNGPLCVVMLGAEASKWASLSPDFAAILYSIHFV